MDIVVADEQSALAVSSNSILVFVDETGEEWFQNPNYPVFGLGGCAVAAGLYFSTVAPAWRALKRRHFGGGDARLHACEISLDNKGGIEALGLFFREHLFCRIAVALTHLTSRPETLEPYQITAAALRNRLVEVVRFWTPLDTIELIVEQSQRGDELARKYLSGFQYWREIDGQRSNVPVGRHFMPKSLAEPGLEIADFVMHAVGGRTRARLAGRKRERADFRAVFDEVDSRLVSFIEVTHTIAH